MAETWTTPEEVARESEELGQSEMAQVFKTEVAVHLKGANLCAFLRQEAGLHTLSADCWPDVFQRLLVSVYAEISRFNQSPSVRKELSRWVRIYRDHVSSLRKVELSVHRLGLTGYFEQVLADDEEKAIYDFYRAKDTWARVVMDCPRIFYPLPHCLRIEDPSKTKKKKDLEDVCTPRQEILERERIWMKKTSEDERYDEERGLAISKESHNFRMCYYRKDSVWIGIERTSRFGRHLALLTAMVQSQRNESFQVVIVLGFLALTDDFYSGDRVFSEDPTRGQIVRIVRYDIYRFLAKALCALHAHLDLPLACLEMMKRSSYPEVESPSPCLSDRGFTALVQMEIFVKYGFYSEAQELFWKWQGKFPSATVIHEELVMLQAAGILHSVQELLMEIWLTLKTHSQCDYNHGKMYLRHCWTEFVLPMVKVLYSKVYSLQSLLYRCLSDVAIRADFRLDLQYALSLSNFYKITAQSISVQGQLDCDLELENVWTQLQADQQPRKPNKMSNHLASFQLPLPSKSSDFFWKAHESSIAVKEILRFYCHVETPRIHADNLFTILTSALFHQRYNEFGVEVIRETLDSYRQSTGGRHHRIGLLNRYLSLKESPASVILPSAFTLDYSNVAFMTIPPPTNPLADAEFLETKTKTTTTTKKKKKILVHPYAREDELSSVDLTASQIRAFAVSTMRDCLDDFEGRDFGCSEKFCRYLRERDELMTVWIDSGLKCCRFATHL